MKPDINLTQIVFIGSLGFFGSIVRFYLGNLNHNFPIGTLLANLIGCFILGLIFQSTLPLSTRLIVIAGFCGSLTTMSGFLLEIINLFKEERYYSMGIYLLTSLGLGTVSILLGSKLTSHFQ